MEDAAHRERLERARLKNLEYMRKLDGQQAAREADALLASVAKQFGPQYATGEKDYDDLKHERRGAKPRTNAVAKQNTSVYITGLTTYIACRQLGTGAYHDRVAVLDNSGGAQCCFVVSAEGMCAKIGKVRRIKFYKDDRGGLKLNHFEIKPGVLITAAPAQFNAKPAATSAVENGVAAGDATSQPEPERLFVPDQLDLQSPQANREATTLSASVTENTTTALEPEPAHLELPSKAIILKHIWDPLAPQETTSFFDELEDDMRSECSKFGAVEHVHIVADGSVLVRFHALESAIKCLQVMNGRWFDGRKIDARFDQSTPEEPDDADTKLEAFLATIG
ncbi:Hiv tat-specific factor 1, partial [Globisporangium splendens]